MSEIEKSALRAANDNPWYCLATLHGEQPVGYLDLELADKNCRDWNRWFQDMTEGQRAELKEAFTRRTGRPEMPPEPATDPDFSKTRFDRKVIFAGFIFGRPTNFSLAVF